MSVKITKLNFKCLALILYIFIYGCSDNFKKKDSYDDIHNVKVVRNNDSDFEKSSPERDNNSPEYDQSLPEYGNSSPVHDSGSPTQEKKSSNPLRTDSFSSFLSRTISKISGKKNQHPNDFVISTEFIEKFKDIYKNEFSLDDAIVRRDLYELINFNNLTSNEKKYQSLLALLNRLDLHKRVSLSNFHVSEYVKMYSELINYFKVLYKKTSLTLPKKIHFVWLGGPLGKYEKEYISIWKQKNPEYEINVWYDSYNLNNYEVQKKLKEYVKVMLSENINSPNYNSIYVEKVIDMQNKLNKYLNDHKNSNKSFDKLRFEFMNSLMYKNQTSITTQIREVDVSHFLEIINNLNDYGTSKNIIAKDIRNQLQNWKLKEFYEQELNLRSNFAAASDLARLEILKAEGGFYIDTDVLPQYQEMNDIDNSMIKPLLQYEGENKFKIMNFFYHNEAFKKRDKKVLIHRDTDPNFYDLPVKNYDEFSKTLSLDNMNVKSFDKNYLSTKILEHIDSFNSNKDFYDHFSELDEVKIRPDNFITAYENNNVIISHKITGNSNHHLEKLINNIRDNYLQLNSVSKNNPDNIYPSVMIHSSYNSKYDSFKKALENYRYDTLKKDRFATVFISGPEAIKNYRDHYRMSTNNNEIKFIFELGLKNEYFNFNTSESLNSSWVNSRNVEEQKNINIVIQCDKTKNSSKATEYFEKYFESINKNEKYEVLDLNQSIPSKYKSSFKSNFNIFVIGNDLANTDKNNEVAKYITTSLIDSPNKIEFINILSCGTSHCDSGSGIESYAKNMLEHINKNYISANLAIIRDSYIKITEHGRILSPQRFGLYYNGVRNNKIFILRNENNSYISLNDKVLSNISYSDISSINRFYNVMKDIFSKKSRHLGEFNQYFEDFHVAKNEYDYLNNSIVYDDVNSGSKDKYLESHKKLINSVSVNDLHEYLNLSKLLSKYKNNDTYATFDVSFQISLFLKKMLNKYSHLKDNEFFNKKVEYHSKIFEDSKSKILNEAKINSEDITKILTKINIQEKEKPLFWTVNNDDKSILVFHDDKKVSYKRNISNLTQDEFIKLSEINNLIKNKSEKMYHAYAEQELHQKASGPTFGLSHVFFVKSFYEYLGMSNDQLINSNMSSSYQNIVKAHFINNLAQMSLDYVDTATKIVTVIDSLKNNELNTILNVNRVSKVSFAANVGLSILNIVFDSLEVYADPSAANITSLTIDSAATSLFLGGLAVGESTALGTFLPGLGQIFAGLSVGISSYVKIAAEHTQDAKNIATYFHEYLNDHNKVINADLYYPKTNNTVLTLAHKNFEIEGNTIKGSQQLNVVFEELDFRTSKTLKIAFGDHLTYPLANYTRGNKNYFIQAPSFYLDKSSDKRVRFREALELPKRMSIDIGSVNKIILPNQVQDIIEYGFMLNPGITWSDDEVFKTTDLIEKNSDFLFRYAPSSMITPVIGNRSISDLKFIPQNTNITIRLNDLNNNLQLITPEIQSNFYNKINYNFVVYRNIYEKSNFHLYLSQGANYSVETTGKENWFFYLKEKFDYIEMEGKNLKIYYKENNITKYYTILFKNFIAENILIYDKTGFTYVVMNKGIILKKTPISVDETVDLNNFETEYDLLTMLRQVRDGNAYGKIKILNYKNLKDNEYIYYINKLDSLVTTKVNNDDLEFVGMIANETISIDTNAEKLYIGDKEILKDTKKEVNSTANNKYITIVNDKYELIFDIENNSNLTIHYWCNSSQSASQEVKSYKYLKDSICNFRDIVNEYTDFIKHFDIVKVKQTEFLDSTNRTNNNYFYSIISNKTFPIESSSTGKILKNYNIKNNKNYYYIFEKNLNIIELSGNLLENKIENTFEYQLSGLKAEIIDDENTIFSDDRFYYDFSNVSKFKIISVKENYLKEFSDKTIDEVLNSVNNNSDIISINIGNVQYIYNFKEKLFYLASSEFNFIGRSLRDKEKFYFYHKERNKFYSSKYEYLDPKQYFIKKMGKSISLNTNNKKFVLIEENNVLEDIKTIENVKFDLFSVYLKNLNTLEASSFNISNKNKTELMIRDKSDLNIDLTKIYTVSDNKLVVCKIDNNSGIFKFCNNMEASSLLTPVDVVVVNKTAYVTDRGNGGYIVKCNIGSDDKVTSCVNSGAIMPLSSEEINTITYNNNNIYVTFVGANYNAKGSYKYEIQNDGTLKNGIQMSNSSGYPIGISFIEDKIYYANWDEKYGVRNCLIKYNSNCRDMRTNGEINSILNGNMTRSVAFANKEIAIIHMNSGIFTCHLDSSNNIKAETCVKSDLSGSVSVINSFIYAADSSKILKCELNENGNLFASNCFNALSNYLDNRELVFSSKFYYNVGNVFIKAY